MKSLQTSLFFAAMLGLLALWGSAWGVESGESIQGLISHWKFDEVSGTTAYDSAGSNDGTVYGATWTTGHIDGALDFDGVDDYVEIPDDPELRLLSTDFAIGAWIKPNSITGGVIISKRNYDINDGSGNNRGWCTGLREGELLFVIFGTAEYITAGANIKTNTWQYVTYVFDNSNNVISVYKDGGFLENLHTGEISFSDKSVIIGATSKYYPGPVAPSNGTIDEVAIYNRTLSAEEIWQLYQGEVPNVVGLEIVGPGEVAEDFQAQYKAIAYFDNNSTADVTALAEWSVEPNTAANIDGNGILTTKDIVTHQSATILASYTEGDVTIEAEKAINIFPICPIGTALRFDGVDDYVDFSKNIITTTEFTVSAWANNYGSPGGSTPVHNAIFQQRDDESRAGYAQSLILLATEYPGDYAAAIIRSSGGSSTQSLTYPKKNYNQWHHYAMIVDSIDFTFYIDGVEVDRTSNDQAGDYVTSIDYVSIGRHSYRGANRGLFNGAIDEVTIYNRALSAEEIRANMHRRLAGDEPNLVGYWDFDEGEGQIVYDLSGNGNDGQLGSTPEADSSDPAWVESDAPIGICTPYQIATMAVDRALECKTALIEELLAALAEEWTAYEALEELLESGDYGDLNKGDIVTAKQKIHSAIQHEEQAINALEKSIEKLEDALSALGYEPEPPPPPPPPPGQASNPNPADGPRSVVINADLSWTAGSNAVSHDVYFGTTSPGTFRGNQTATTFDPGTMAENTTYYWRIDEVNPGGTTTGTVWSFTTGSGGWPSPI